MKFLTSKNVRLYFFVALFICLAFHYLVGMADPRNPERFRRGQRALKENKTMGLPDIVKRLKALEEKQVFKIASETRLI